MNACFKHISGWQLFGGSPGEASPLSKLPRSDLDDLRSSFVHSKEAKQFAVAFEAFRLREKSIELLAFIPILSYLTFAVIAAGIDEKIVKKMGPRSVPVGNKSKRDETKIKLLKPTIMPLFYLRQSPRRRLIDWNELLLLLLLLCCCCCNKACHFGIPTWNVYVFYCP